MLSKKNRILETLLFCAAIAPAFFLGFLVVKYSVNVPFWDQWNTPGDALEKIYKGELSFGDLIAQHNESRKLFPRIIFIGLAYLTHWNVKYEMLLIFLAACATSLNTYFLCRLTVSSSELYLLFLAFLVNLLIFSPAQYENWLWGIQLVVFIPILCITSCLLVSHSKMKMGIKLALCISIATVSTYSYANGMLCWVAFLPALILSGAWSSLKWKRLLVFIWASAFLLNIGLYFRNYHKPPGHPGFGESVTHPLKALTYFFSFLGSPLSGSNTTIATAVGVLLTAIFALLIGYLLFKSRKQRNIIHRLSGWLIIGLYALASAAITTLGRVGFGVEQSLASRYTTFSLFLGVSLIPLFAILIDVNNYQDKISSEDNISKSNLKSASQILFATVVTAIVTLHLVSSVPSVQALQSASRDRLYAKTCLVFMQFVDRECIASSLFPLPNFLRHRVRVIQKMGLLEVKLAKDAKIEQAASHSALNVYGSFDTLGQAGSNQYIAKGWAILPGSAKPSDAVLLTYRDAQGNSVIFDIARVNEKREDVAIVMHDAAYVTSGWTASFSSKKLPSGQLEISAWAFDTSSEEAFRLNTSHLAQH